MERKENRLSPGLFRQLKKNPGYKEKSTQKTEKEQQIEWEETPNAVVPRNHKKKVYRRGGNVQLY